MGPSLYMVVDNILFAIHDCCSKRGATVRAVDVVIYLLDQKPDCSQLSVSGSLISAIGFDKDSLSALPPCEIRTCAVLMCPWNKTRKIGKTFVEFMDARLVSTRSWTISLRPSVAANAVKLICVLACNNGPNNV